MTDTDSGKRLSDAQTQLAYETFMAFMEDETRAGKAKNITRREIEWVKEALNLVVSQALAHAPSQPAPVVANK